MNTIDEKTLAENSDALCLAAREGNIDEVRRLIPISDPSVYDYQPLTWAVYYRYTDILRELVPVSDINRSGALHKLLDQAAVNGDAKSLEVLLSYYAATLPNDVYTHQIFTSAAKSGNVECLNLLLPFCDPKNSDSKALKTAVLYKHIDAIEFLIPLSDTQGVQANEMLLDVVKTSEPHNSKSREVAVLLQLPYLTLMTVADPKSNNSQAFRAAVRNNHLSCVTLLMPVSDANARNSEALRVAAANGFSQYVDMLLPMASVEECTQALVAAVQHNHIACIELLTPHLDQAELFKIISESNLTSDVLSSLDALMAQHQHTLLNTEVVVQNQSVAHASRKI